MAALSKADGENPRGRSWKPDRVVRCETGATRFQSSRRPLAQFDRLRSRRDDRRGKKALRLRRKRQRSDASFRGVRESCAGSVWSDFAATLWSVSTGISPTPGGRFTRRYDGVSAAGDRFGGAGRITKPTLNRGVRLVMPADFPVCNCGLWPEFRI